MRCVLLSLVAVIVGCTAANPETISVDAKYAIPNPQRPGAKAPDCRKLIETADGCTFHTRKNEVNLARLPTEADAVWTAKTTDTELIDVRKTEDVTTSDGGRRQVFELVPSTSQNADVVVTFDKVAGSIGDPRVIERRRVNVMIHAATPQ